MTVIAVLCETCNCALVCPNCKEGIKLESVNCTMPDGLKYVLYVAASQADQFAAYVKQFGERDTSEEN